MQTFLPYPSFRLSAETLDWRRLGKQRVEAYQILNILTGKTAKNGWAHHPAVRMWRGYEQALMHYTNAVIEEWILRGYGNTMERYVVPPPPDVRYPLWLGDEKFHASHRSNLLRKDPEFYSRFGWHEPTNLPYVWPV